MSRESFYNFLLDSGVTEIQALSIINKTFNAKLLNAALESHELFYINGNFLMLQDVNGVYRPFKRINPNVATYQFCDINDPDAAG
jgi:hypothetical protein